MAFGSRNSRRGSRPLLARWRHGAAAAPPLLGGDKKTSKRVAAVLHSTIQRLPLISHIVMLFLALYGPTQGQYYVAFVFFTLHIVLVSSQLRTAYGMIRCLYFVRAHAATNWWDYYVQHSKNAPASALETPYTPRTLPHLIVIPSYKESMATLTQTLSILASHPLAKATYKVCLAMEEREAGSRAKGESLRAQYVDKFLDISVSIHPSGLPGEVAGKGSNVGWGARWLVEREFMAADFDDDEEEARSATIPDGILTVMDADTAFASDYFLAAAVKYLLSEPEKRERMMFVPPIIFDRNQADVPGITRVTDIMWAAVSLTQFLRSGIGGIYPSSLVKVPTSAYSVSIGLATHVGFWDTGPEAIGEDMHMFCKSLLDTRGHLHVETIYSPASQCNVIGPRFSNQTKVQRFIGDSHARWTQGVRHLWGSLDTTYVWTRFLTGDFGVSPQREAEHRLARLEMRKHVQQDRINNGYDTADRYASDSDANDYFSRPQTTKATRVRLQVRTQGEELGDMELFRKKANHHIPGRHVSRLPAWAASPGVIDTESSASSFVSGDASPPSPIDTQSDYSFSSVGDDGSPTNTDVRPTIRTKHSRAATKRQLESIGLVRDRSAATPAPAQRRQDRTRLLPILVLLIRLYEAHLMIGHFVILVSIIVFWPPLRDLFQGTYVFSTPKADFWNWSVIEDRWSWKDKDRVLNTAIELSWRLGVLGALATVIIWIYHDRYHMEACSRWTRQHPTKQVAGQPPMSATSEKNLEIFGTDNSAGFDAHDLGLRPSPFSERKLPRSLYEYVSMPGGLLFGAIPLLYSHFWHLWTDKLAYTVSAKPSVAPVTVKELRE
ncbi:hypothetical protein PIIN_07964 [Serendipita indica DSM 11827]|uniref:Glycosyltransferase 2-like domain-containing protein n=1 Tax=Serendipita indica (strain DSM 11827) TaxID=1109443 RepID=G4TRR7_SERID|nr:hypothetical protein PIIN_07964 [Serendipita indica DSM 11827]